MEGSGERAARGLKGDDNSVPDAAAQLQGIYLAGFEIETFEQFPNAVGVAKGGCIALVEPTANGLRLIGQPGWRMGGVLGVLVELGGKKIFQAKSERVEATPDRLAELEHFRYELEELMTSRA
jgi:hypothetical protein